MQVQLTHLMLTEGQFEEKILQNVTVTERTDTKKLMRDLAAKHWPLRQYNVRLDRNPVLFPYIAVDAAGEVLFLK